MDAKVSRLGSSFLLTEFRADKGDIRNLEFPEDTTRDRMTHLSIYLEGRFVVRDVNGNVVNYRKPGDFSHEMPDVKAGVYTLEALEDGSRSVCIWPRVEGVIIKVHPIRARAGQSFPILPGRFFYLAKGVAEIGGQDRPERFSALVESKGVVGTAKTDVIAASVWV
ncbi:MAG: hypothetical protein ACK4FJ_18555 [Ferrovibrio sp.]|uniref:hypothetical protein n=1 Tax=Ferrovibrio sp. TaxID=1917215 RepID=UPI00391AF75B